MSKHKTPPHSTLPHPPDRADDDRLRGAGTASTVLLVEDESALLTMTSMFLEHLGFRVLPADSPQRAIEISRSCNEHIGLLLTDIDMPEMSGGDLAAYLLTSHTGMRCLFMSGYSAEIAADLGVTDIDSTYIQKPFSLKDLERKIRNLLQATS